AGFPRRRGLDGLRRRRHDVPGVLATEPRRPVPRLRRQLRASRGQPGAARDDPDPAGRAELALSPQTRGVPADHHRDLAAQPEEKPPAVSAWPRRTWLTRV